jgi:hypothetical protein
MKPTCPNTKQKCIAHKYSLIKKLGVIHDFERLCALAHKDGTGMELRVATTLPIPKILYTYYLYRY